MGTPNFTYKQLRAFVEVASTGSYASASRNLNITQPALSISVKNLESVIGGALFVRSTRSTQLTPEGEVFLPKAKHLLRDWETAYDDMHSLFYLQQGTLCIAAMPSFASSQLPSILARFHGDCPSIKLTVLDVVMEDVVRLVQASKAELGFVFKPDQLSGLEFHPLFTNDFIVVCHPNHHFAKYETVSWPDLSGESMVAMNRGASIRNWIDRIALAKNCDVGIVAQANQLETLGQLVAIELGIAVVPALCVEQMRNKSLCCIPLKDSGLERQVGLIWPSKANVSTAAKLLIKQITLS